MSSCCPARPGRIVGDIVDTVTGVVAATGADNVAAATADVDASTAADNVPDLNDADVVVKPSV